MSKNGLTLLRVKRGGKTNLPPTANGSHNQLVASGQPIVMSDYNYLDSSSKPRHFGR